MPDGSRHLIRGLDLSSATALNIVDMVGVGPFITLPLMVATLHGPQAIYGWIAGAIVAISDGLIWAELAAAMPKAGGSYAYLQTLFGPKLGRMLAFVFVLQLVFSAPASIATGCIGLASYAKFLLPQLGNGTKLLAMAVAAFATFCVSRGIEGVARISKWLWAGVLLALFFVIFAAWTHWSYRMAFPTGWARPQPGFSTGFSTALLIALYDYWGYYNIAFLGEEVRAPERNIPRAVVISIGVVTLLYVAMNVGVLGVLPVTEITTTGKTFVAARLLQKIWGSWAGAIVSILVMWTAFASVFSLLAGYSRIPFAAARDGNFPKFFAAIREKGLYPARSVLLLGGVACLLCLVELPSLIRALVVVRVLLVFALQAVGIVLWRMREPAAKRPFRMWLYPLPVVISIVGYALVIWDKRSLALQAIVFAAAGSVLYFIIQRRTVKPA